MTEKIASLIDPLIQAINNKIASVTVAAGVAVTGQVAQTTTNPHLKSLAEISITEIFSHELSAASVATIIGSFYIVFQFVRETIKGLIWLWKNSNVFKKR